MRMCKPEGWGGPPLPAGESGWREAVRDGRILEAPAAYCDADHNLHVRLGGGFGVIPRQDAALGLDSGKTKAIAVLSRVGKPVCFRAVGIADDGQVLLSRRQAQLDAYEQLVNTAPPGTVLDARVTHLESFGVFVDVGWGFVSFIGIENLSVSRIAHPSERLRVGWDIKAVVTGYQPQRVLLSHKELLGTWQENAALFSPGETVQGIVRGVEDYGVFVELLPNLSGLCEKTDGLREGERVVVYIKSILPERMKIKLNLIDRLPAEDPPPRPRYFLPEGRLDLWRYSPPGCRAKQVETVFGHTG